MLSLSLILLINLSLTIDFFQPFVFLKFLIDYGTQCVEEQRRGLLVFMTGNGYILFIAGPFVWDIESMQSGYQLSLRFIVAKAICSEPPAVNFLIITLFLSWGQFFRAFISISLFYHKFWSFPGFSAYSCPSHSRLLLIGFGVSLVREYRAVLCCPGSISVKAVSNLCLEVKGLVSNIQVRVRGQKFSTQFASICSFLLFLL